MSGSAVIINSLSTDGGKTWSFDSTCKPVQNYYSINGINGTGFAPNFNGSKTANLYYTKNYWKTYDSILVRPNILYSDRNIDGHTLYFQTPENFYRTKNFGKTMDSFSTNNFPLNVNTQGLADVKVIKGDIYATFSKLTDRDSFFYSNYVFKSSDFGTSWDTLFKDENVNYNLEKLLIYDKLNFVLQGINNTIFRTDNGGKDWYREPLKELGEYQITDINFSPPSKTNKGFMVLLTGGSLIKYSTTFTTAIETSNSTIKMGKLDIFPNPSTGLFSIFNGNVENSLISVFNSTGQMIVSNLLLKNGVSTSIDLSSYSNGIYFIRNNFGEYQKILKN